MLLKLIRSGILIGGVAVLAIGLGLRYAQAYNGAFPTQAPLMLDQIKELLPILPDVALAGEIGERGINFPVTSQILNDLKAGGAGAQTIRAISAFLANHPPTVSFAFDQPDVQQGQAVALFADAQDPDGDQVMYFWESSAGRMLGTGATVKLDTSPLGSLSDVADVVVTLTVIDRKGGSNSFSKAIRVKRPGGQTKSSEDSQSKVVYRHATIQEASLEGKYALVHLEGEGRSDGAEWGFIEISLMISKTGALLQSVTGGVPGRPCRVDVLARENVAEISFKEPPGTFNDWKKTLLRVRAKDSQRVIRFAIYWQVLKPLSTR